MAIGIMEVKLVGAKDLKRNGYDCLCAFLSGKLGPYTLLQYRNQECKSNTAKGKGNSPVWDDKFEFRVDSPLADDDQYKLMLKIMDHNTFCADDYLGEAKIYVKELIELGVEKGKAELGPQKYRVVSTNKTYHGEIQVGITFTAKIDSNIGHVVRQKSILSNYAEMNWIEKSKYHRDRFIPPAIDDVAEALLSTGYQPIDGETEPMNVDHQLPVEETRIVDSGGRNTPIFIH